MVGGKRCDIGAGCREPVNDHDHRLFALQLAQRVVELFGAGGGAAWAVDMDDHRARARSAKPFKRLDPVLIAADKALNLDARDIGAWRHQAAAGNKEKRAAADCDQRHHDSAVTRQNVSLRRMRRRSTMASASSDMVSLHLVHA